MYVHFPDQNSVNFKRLKFNVDLPYTNTMVAYKRKGAIAESRKRKNLKDKDGNMTESLKEKMGTCSSN